MTPILWTGKRFSGRVLSEPVIVGGANNIDLANVSGIQIDGGILCNPTGEAGSDRHNIKCQRCTSIRIMRTVIANTKPSGDCINLYNCRDCTIVGVRISGPLEMKSDKAADIVIDGAAECDMGSDHIIRNLKARRIVIAHGSGHRLVNVIADVIEISGEAYDGNPARIVEDVRLVRCQVGEVYVHGPTTRKIRADAASVIDWNYVPKKNRTVKA